MIETQRLTEERLYVVAAGNVALSLLCGINAGYLWQRIGAHL